MEDECLCFEKATFISSDIYACGKRSANQGAGLSDRVGSRILLCDDVQLLNQEVKFFMFSPASQDRTHQKCQNY